MYLVIHKYNIFPKKEKERKKKEWVRRAATKGSSVNLEETASEAKTDGL